MNQVKAFVSHYLHHREHDLIEHVSKLRAWVAEMYFTLNPETINRNSGGHEIPSKQPSRLPVTVLGFGIDCD